MLPIAQHLPKLTQFVDLLAQLLVIPQQAMTEHLSAYASIELLLEDEQSCALLRRERRLQIGIQLDLSLLYLTRKISRLLHQHIDIGTWLTTITELADLDQHFIPLTDE